MQVVEEKELSAASSRRKKLFAIYLALAAAFLAAVLLLFFFSKHDYAPYLVGNVLLTMGFGFYSVYFFTVRYFDLRKYEKYLERVLSALPVKEYGVYLRSEGNVTKEGVVFEALIFRIRGDERKICSFKKELSLSSGVEYLLETRAGVLTMYEVRDERAL